MLKAITLDFWGTLVDDRHSAVPWRIAALAEYFPSFSQARLMDAYMASWERFLQAERAGWGLPPATMLSQTLDELGVSLPPHAYANVLRRWETTSLEHPPSLVPGVIETLKTLRARGFAIGLISDTGVTPGRVLRELMVKMGIRHLFDWLTFSNELGVTKARPQAFLTTLRALNATPSEALHVGDTPAMDIVGAKRVGMRTALTIEVRDKRTGHETPDLLLERLVDLPAALARW